LFTGSKVEESRGGIEKGEPEIGALISEIPPEIGGWGPENQKVRRPETKKGLTVHSILGAMLTNPFPFLSPKS